jgi:hypothetical protein
MWRAFISLRADWRNLSRGFIMNSNPDKFSRDKINHLGWQTIVSLFGS